jgi:hypothetical protein
MPARHTSLPDSLLLEADFESRLWSTKEGVGETSGQTAGSSFWGVRSLKPVRQKKQVFFVRCGSLRSAISPGRKARLRSGPDVFADALVPFRCSLPVPIAPGAALNPILQNPLMSVLISHGLKAGVFCALASRHAFAADGYRFTKRHGKPNSRNRQ